MKTIYNVLVIIMGVLVGICFIFSIIGALVHKKRTGSLPIGQGFGRK